MLLQLEESQMRYCMPRIQAVATGSRSRFDSYLGLHPEVNDVIMVAISHPFFKLRCFSICKEHERRNFELVSAARMKEYFVSAVKLKEVTAETLISTSNYGGKQQSCKSAEDLFLFDSTSAHSTTSSAAVKLLKKIILLLI